MSDGSEIPIARAIRGPVTLITLGVLFALNNFTPYRFEQTWPVLLIVFGLLSLLRRSTEPPRPVAPPPYPPQAASPGPAWTGNYRQSNYQDPNNPAPSSPSKGGFGSTAAPAMADTPRTADTPQGTSGGNMTGGTV